MRGEAPEPETVTEAEPAALRLQVALARAGIASRRAAAQLIESGRVTVNGQAIRLPGCKVDPSRDEVALDGERLIIGERHQYYALHKPRGVLSSVGDSRGRRTVVDFLPPDAGRCVPVGRLDLDSEGLLLLTNDGPLVTALLHPRSRLPREYLVEVEGRVSNDTLDQIHAGVPLPDGTMASAKPKRSRRPGRAPHRDRPGTSWLIVTLHQGRKREVRQLCAAVDHPVRRLIRVRFGPIRLRDMRPSEIRTLSDREVRLLQQQAAAAPAQPKPPV